LNATAYEGQLAMHRKLSGQKSFFGKTEPVGYVIDADGWTATLIDYRWYAGPPPAYVTSQELAEESEFQAAKSIKLARAAIAKWPDFEMPATLPDKNRFRLTPEEFSRACKGAKEFIEAEKKFMEETFGTDREPKTPEEEELKRMD
jgi:hypothetical protein